MESHKALDVKDAHNATLKVHYIKRILTYNGKIREAEVKLPYNPACQEAKLIRAVVTSKNGQTQEISKDEMNIMDEGWNASAKRYTGGKVLVANLPGVDIGSTIDVEFELVDKGTPFISGFETFQFFDDLDKKTFQLTAPDTLQVRKLMSGPGGIVKEEDKPANGEQQFEWRAENVKALPPGTATAA